MSQEVRTFIIPDQDSVEASANLGSFLRTVVTTRIDTAYSDGAWRVLVLFEDARLKEESAQIKTAIMGALVVWRDREAKRNDCPKDDILTDAMIDEVSHYAPTTERELSLIATTQNMAMGKYGASVVAVVKQTLDALID